MCRGGQANTSFTPYIFDSNNFSKWVAKSIVYTSSVQSLASDKKKTKTTTTK